MQTVLHVLLCQVVIVEWITDTCSSLHMIWSPEWKLPVYGSTVSRNDNYCLHLWIPVAVHSGMWLPPLTRMKGFAGIKGCNYLHYSLCCALVADCFWLHKHSISSHVMHYQSDFWIGSHGIVDSPGSVLHIWVCIIGTYLLIIAQRRHFSVHTLLYDPNHHNDQYVCFHEHSIGCVHYWRLGAMYRVIVNECW